MISVLFQSYLFEKLKKKMIYLIAPFFEVLAYYNGYIILYQIMILPFLCVCLYPYTHLAEFNPQSSSVLKSECLSHSVVSDSLGPLVCSLLNSFVHGILQARILERVAISFFRNLPNPEIEPRSPALQVNSLPTEPTWKLCF